MYVNFGREALNSNLYPQSGYLFPDPAPAGEGISDSAFAGERC